MEHEEFLEFVGSIHGSPVEPFADGLIEDASAKRGRDLPIIAKPTGRRGYQFNFMETEEERDGLTAATGAKFCYDGAKISFTRMFNLRKGIGNMSGQLVELQRVGRQHHRR